MPVGHVQCTTASSGSCSGRCLGTACMATDCSSSVCALHHGPKGAATSTHRSSACMPLRYIIIDVCWDAAGFQHLPPILSFKLETVIGLSVSAGTPLGGGPADSSSRVQLHGSGRRRYVLSHGSHVSWEPGLVQSAGPVDCFCGNNAGGKRLHSSVGCFCGDAGDDWLHSSGMQLSSRPVD